MPGAWIRFADLEGLLGLEPLERHQSQTLRTESDCVAVDVQGHRTRGQAEVSPDVGEGGLFTLSDN